MLMCGKVSQRNFVELIQGEPARCVEYIVDILPLLQRERPNLFDGSDLEPDGYYREQWQLALPLE